MATFKLSFNSKSKSRNIPRAIKLSKTNFSQFYQENGNTFTIETEECTRSFSNILRIIKNLKGTILKVDTETIDDIDQFVSIVECHNNDCQGICTIISDYSFQLEFLAITEKDPSSCYNTVRWNYYQYDDAIDLFKDHIVIYRDIFLSHYKDDTRLVKKICPQYDLIKIKERFLRLPEIIEINTKTDPFGILDALANAPSSVEFNSDNADMVVHISKESIQAMGEEIAWRLEEFYKTGNK